MWIINKIYFITGASSDIGLNLIESIESKNESCIVIAQCFSSCARLAEMQKKTKCVKMNLLPCNLAEEDEVLGIIDKICVQFGCPTHIVHLAAEKFNFMRIRDFDWKKTERELEIQVHAFAEILKVFCPRMAKQGYGRIVAMLTAYTIGIPPKFMSHYIITKYALLGLVRSAASEYAGKGLSINGLSPDMIETKFLANLDPRAIELNAKSSAMGRNVAINEVVGALEFLLSDSASYMTGVNLNLTGGDRM